MKHKGNVVKSYNDLLILRDSKKSVLMLHGASYRNYSASWVLNMSFALVSKALNEDRIYEYKK